MFDIIYCLEPNLYFTKKASYTVPVKNEIISQSKIRKSVMKKKNLTLT